MAEHSKVPNAFSASKNPPLHKKLAMSPHSIAMQRFKQPRFISCTTANKPGKQWPRLMPGLLLFGLIFCASLCLSTASNILFLHPMHSPSHVLALRTLALEMVSRGHQVTIVRPHDRRIPPLEAANVTEIYVVIDNTEGDVPMMSAEKEAQFEMPMAVMWQKGTSFTALPFNGFLALSAYCNRLLSDDQLIYKLKSKTFHLAVVDLIYNECSLALAHHLDLPVVGYWAFTFAGGEPQYTTAFNPPSSTPLILSHLPDHMTFLQRVWSHFLLCCNEIVMKLTFWTTDYHISRHLPGTPSSAWLLSNLSGVLINSHPAIDYPRLLPPSFLEVGRFHIKSPKPLPKNLSQYIDNSNGTILFALGFSFDSSFVPGEVISAYLRAFSKVTHNVIMVVKGSVQEHIIPQNVKIIQWVPQVDVLSHPKIVLFITHCGMHGVLESLTYGVPMVGIPIFADQKDVLLRLEERGLAKGVEKHSSAEELYGAIVEVLSNSSYREQALRYSGILKDQQSNPLQSAVWLLEHVMSTGGAHHLKLASRHLSIWQYLGIDVLLFLLLIVALIIFAFLRVMKCLFAAPLQKRRIKFANIHDKKEKAA